MKLGKILTAINKIIPLQACFSDSAASEREIGGIECDSRRAGAGTLFFCLPGAQTDGHLFAPSAYERGCRDFVVERRLDLPDDAVQIPLSDARRALSAAAAEFYGRPGDKLRLIGITGTKGKSTVAAFIYGILRRAGKNAAMIGTLGVFIGDEHTPSANTTPDSLTLNRLFAEMVSRGIEYAVLEVSSQSYLTNRVEGLTFEAGIFTNLSRDHIGYPEHPDMENYAWCKSRLFTQSRVSIINADDAAHSLMEKAAESAGSRIIRYGLGSDADIRAIGADRWSGGGALGIGFELAGELAGGKNVPMRLPMPGLFNVYNAAAAAAGAFYAAGIAPEVSAKALSDVKVRGRFELAAAPQGRTFIIDYAHNALSLRSVLEEIRAYNPRRLTLLIGSVGGRTRERRTELGAIASELADFVIITSDNPDREDPEAICREIAAAVEGCPFVIIPDRAEAVRYTVESADEGEVVLFAGKGHEEYQLIDGVRLPYSDASAIAAAMEAMKLAQ